MKHTKEPWISRSFFEGIIHIWDGERAVAEVHFPYGKRHDKESEANAKRIIACVNACAGITDEALENGIVMGCIKIARIVNNPEVKKDSELRWMGVQVFEEGV